MSVTPATPEASQEDINAWLPDPRFGGLDMRTSPDPLAAALPFNLGDDEPVDEDDPTDENLEAPAPTAPARDENEPRVIQNPDGSTTTIEKTKRGWCATLDTGTGAQPEKFYGNTKDEMWIAVAAGKAHATKKIRDLNRKLKLGEVAPAKPAPAPRSAPVKKSLSAEDKVQLQTQIVTDPEAALDTYFLKKYGVSPDELISNSRDGAAARRALVMEEACRGFLAANPGYFNHDDNYAMLVGFLAKQFLNQRVTDANRDAVIINLVDGGYFTVDNLSDAYEELNDEGLLLVAPQSQAPAAPVAPEPAPVAAVPAVTPAGARGTRTERRPRAGFGLRPSEVSSTSAAPEPTKPPSDQEFASMTDEQIANLFAGVRALKARRS